MRGGSLWALRWALALAETAAGASADGRFFLEPSRFAPDALGGHAVRVPTGALPRLAVPVAARPVTWVGAAPAGRAQGPDGAQQWVAVAVVALAVGGSVGSALRQDTEKPEQSDTDFPAPERHYSRNEQYFRSAGADRPEEALENRRRGPFRREHPDSADAPVGAADVAEHGAVPDSLLNRFQRLEDETQQLALRQLRNPGRSSKGEKTTKKMSKRVGRSKALPFDFSNQSGQKKKEKDTSAQKARTLEELTSSRASFELESTLRLGADNLALYLKSIGVHPLLAPEEEVMLGQTIEDGVKAKAALASGDFGGSTKQELEWISGQGDSAFSAFVLSNLRLVVWTAKKYFAPEGLTMLDMIQDGNLGLIRSVEKWDWRKGHRFSTYSTWWIRQSIDRGLGVARHVRLPEHMRLQVQRLKKQASLFYSEHGRPPTQTEMAERMNMTVEKYRDVARQLAETTSLDAPIGKGRMASKSGDGDSTALLDLIQTQTHHTPDDALMARSLEDDLKAVVDETLTDRQALVITKRFGLDGGGPKTLQQIGDILDVTRERVRQIEMQALNKLKSDFKCKGLLATLYSQMLEVEHASCNIGD